MVLLSWVSRGGVGVDAASWTYAEDADPLLEMTPTVTGAREAVLQFSVEVIGDQRSGHNAAALTEVAVQLAQAIVRDGEGATKFITVQVDGGRDAAECRQVAYAIAHSPLVKTAFFASDPNLGRILAAVGYAGIADLDQGLIELFLDDVHVATQGARHPAYAEEQGQRAHAEGEEGAGLAAIDEARRRERPGQGRGHEERRLQRHAEEAAREDRGEAEGDAGGEEQGEDAQRAGEQGNDEQARGEQGAEAGRGEGEQAGRGESGSFRAPGCAGGVHGPSLACAPGAGA